MQDPAAWINDWIWTYDPRLKPPIPKRLPLVLWPKQQELIRWYVEGWRKGENGLLKKGRDVGASWLAAAVGVWVWQFHDDTAVTYGSYKADFVDNLGDPDSILEKVREIIRCQPVWMRPEGYKEGVHDGYMKILNPSRNCVIKGEVGDNMGRGGRSSLYFADEFAFVPRAKKVSAAIGDNSDCVVYLSTSNGVGTMFWQKEQTDIRKFYINYRDDPRKRPHEEFKAKKVAEEGETNFAREHEMDDTGAVENVAIPGKWVMAAVGLDIAEGSINESGLDVAGAGANETVYINRRGAVTHRVVAWRLDNTTESAWKARDLMHEDGAAVLKYDADGVGVGVYSPLKTSEQPLKFKFEGINGNGAASKRKYEEYPDRPANERFRNARAESWWLLRRRFQKTYEYVNKIKEYPLDELISIPNDPELIAQLSQPTYSYTESGKIKIESKQDMIARGVKSPDRADALVYAFAITKPKPTLGF